MTRVKLCYDLVSTYRHRIFPFPFLFFLLPSSALPTSCCFWDDMKQSIIEKVMVVESCWPHASQAAAGPEEGRRRQTSRGVSLMTYVLLPGLTS